MMITIHDVARESGVSPATVSRVLSGMKTRDKNKEKVLKAAYDLGYHGFSQNAPYQTDDKSSCDEYHMKNTIFVISSNNIVRSIDGIFSTAQSIGYRVMLITADATPSSEIIKMMDSGEAKGLIILTHPDQQFIAHCVEHYKTVQIHSNQIAPLSHVVSIDSVRAAYELTKELLEHGRRNLWYFSHGAPNAPIIFSSQYNGILTAIEEYGLPSSSVKVINSSKTFFSQDFAAHTPAVEDMLSLSEGDRPDGLILPNSVVGSVMINLLNNFGISVPGDISAVSLIGGDHDHACRPYLTSILVPQYELGQEAMNMLANLIEGRNCPQYLHYAHSIRYAGSSRPELVPYKEIIQK